MDNILWFNEADKDKIELVGGKGANLGEMYNNKLPVPPGFVVTAEAYKLFMEKAGIFDEVMDILEMTNVDNTDQLKESSNKIQKLIMEKPIPDSIKDDISEAYENLNVDPTLFGKAGKEAMDIIKVGREPLFVAVRSSATAEDLPTASFAGQQETFLNVKGLINLLNSVQKCWASLFTARAIYYRAKNNFPHDKVFIAVVVQKMVRSKKAGVMFSINPVSNEENEIVIEAGFGLGDSVVAGEITPDVYTIDKNDFSIKEKTIGNQTWQYVLDTNLSQTVKRDIPEDLGSKQKLTQDEIEKLAELAKRIEEHYGKPQDMEFAIEGSRVYIVQARPITTLKKVKTKEKEIDVKDKEVLLKGLGASSGIGRGIVKIINDIEEIGKIKKGDVLVTEMTNPDMVPAMERSAAIITDEGGVTAHAAIVSREMGIPCVVGTINATEKLKDGDEVTVDGEKGVVYSGLLDIANEEEKQQEVSSNNTQIETVTEIKVLMDLPDYAERAAKTNAAGVGLLRAEFMILKHKEHPVYMIRNGRKDELVNQLKEDILKIAKAFEGKPVWYRTLDAPTDEFRHMKGGENEPEEDNPMLGWRSIRRSLDQPELLRAEFEAMKKVHEEGYTNVGIMLPLITEVEQIRKAKDILREYDLEPMENIEFGVMIETPAAVQIIEDICNEGVDFISFGTNDLAQFTLAIDRNNAHVQKWYNPTHPAILKQIEHVIRVCKEHNVETSICGQSASDPEMAEKLVNMGIDSMSVNVDAVSKIRFTVAKAERKLLLNVARKDMGY